MRRAVRQPVDSCPIGPVVELVFGRWTSHVLWALAHSDRLRFNELHRQIPGITPRVLTERLRQLERDGFISRTYHREIPPRVEYEITALGQTLVPVFRTLTHWSEEHLDAVQAAQHAYDRVRESTSVSSAGRARADHGRPG